MRLKANLTITGITHKDIHNSHVRISVQKRKKRERENDQNYAIQIVLDIYRNLNIKQF